MVTKTAATPQDAYNQKLLQVANTSRGGLFMTGCAAAGTLLGRYVNPGIGIALIGAAATGRAGLFMTGCAVAGSLFGRFVNPRVALALVGAAAAGIAYRWQTRKDPFIHNDTAAVVSSYLDDANEVRGFATHFFGFQPPSSDPLMSAGMNSVALAKLKEEAGFIAKKSAHLAHRREENFFIPESEEIAEMVGHIKAHLPASAKLEPEKLAKELLNEAFYHHLIFELSKSIKHEFMNAKPGQSLKITVSSLETLIQKIAVQTKRDPKHIKAHLFRVLETNHPEFLEAIRRDGRFSPTLLLHPIYQLFLERETERTIREEMRAEIALSEERISPGKARILANPRLFGLQVLPDETVGAYLGRILEMNAQMKIEAQGLEDKVGGMLQAASSKENEDVTRLRDLRKRIVICEAAIDDLYPAFQRDRDRQGQNILALKDIPKAVRDRLQQRIDLMNFLCPERVSSGEELPREPYMGGFSQDNLALIGSHLESLTDIHAFSSFVATQRGEECGRQVAQLAGEDAVLKQIASEMVRGELQEAPDALHVFSEVQSDAHPLVTRLSALLVELQKRLAAKPLSSKIPRKQVDEKECTLRAKSLLKRAGFKVVAGIIGKEITDRITLGLLEKVSEKLARSKTVAKWVVRNFDEITMQLQRLAQLAGKSQDEVVADVRTACTVASGDLRIAKWQCSPKYEYRSNVLESIEDYISTSRQVPAGNEDPSVVANRALDSELDTMRKLILLLEPSTKSSAEVEIYPGGSGGSRATHTAVGAN